MVGTIVRFDGSHGYGFISPDEGGEDVFLHLSLFEEESKPLVRSGARIEFQAVPGDRGLKAVRASLVEDSAGWREGGSDGAGEDDELCDVLSVADFGRQVTDVLIELVPDLTGAQIVRVRDRLVAVARKHRWVEAR